MSKPAAPEPTPAVGGRSPLANWRTVLFGPPKDIRDPRVFHHVSLIAFLAWEGLGADGLSSSCYGPQEAFLALGSHPYLGIFVGLASALTMYIISAIYSQIIELFPSGDQCYLVSCKKTQPNVGMNPDYALI